MGQLTIDLDGETARRVADAAAVAHMAVGDWVAALVRSRVNAEWPPEVRSLAGAWPDLPDAETLRKGLATDAERESW